MSHRSCTLLVSIPACHIWKRLSGYNSCYQKSRFIINEWCTKFVIKLKLKSTSVLYTYRATTSTVLSEYLQSDPCVKGLCVCLNSSEASAHSETKHVPTSRWALQPAINVSTQNTWTEGLNAAVLFLSSLSFTFMCFADTNCCETGISKCRKTPVKSCLHTTQQEAPVWRACLMCQTWTRTVRVKTWGD